MPKITVVFDYIEGAELPKQLTAAFATESTAFGDANITAISMEDEISRAEELESKRIAERVELLSSLDEMIDGIDSHMAVQEEAWLALESDE